MPTMKHRSQPREKTKKARRRQITAHLEIFDRLDLEFQRRVLVTDHDGLGMLLWRRRLYLSASESHSEARASGGTGRGSGCTPLRHLQLVIGQHHIPASGVLQRAAAKRNRSSGVTNTNRRD